MKHKNIFFAALFLTIAAVCIIVAAILNTSQSAKIADISVNGKLYREIDLTAVTEPYTIEIESENGGHNTLLVENGGISMQSADCPDKLCVKRGKITNGNYPIVCLPNKITVEIKDKSEVDAVSGRN